MPLYTNIISIIQFWLLGPNLPSQYKKCNNTKDIPKVRKMFVYKVMTTVFYDCKEVVLVDVL